MSFWQVLMTHSLLGDILYGVSADNTAGNTLRRITTDVTGFDPMWILYIIIAVAVLFVIAMIAK
jgi:hypothetical protein